MSAHLYEEEVEYREGDNNGEYEDGEGEGEGDEDESEVGEEEGERRGEEDEALGSSSDNYRPFIFPKIWLVNDFFSKILDDVFGKLHPHFQIPKDISLRMARRREKCYSGWTEDVSFCEAIFIVRLRLPLTEQH